jgi:hypothetical protein
MDETLRDIFPEGAFAGNWWVIRHMLIENCRIEGGHQLIAA